ncbi:hypothetical protein WG66_001373 [Moniliophthora roreri]|nr:hypothetical protein WG66_001373 [Moniliophthora roreri]
MSCRAGGSLEPWKILNIHPRPLASQYTLAKASSVKDFNIIQVQNTDGSDREHGPFIYQAVSST